MHRSRTPLTRLPKAEFFDGLARKELREILGGGVIRRIGSGQIICMAGEPATHLFLLLSGYVQFYRLSRAGDKVLLARLMKGDIFGLGTLLSRRTLYMGTAEATRDSELLVWENARIRKLAQRYPRLAENALGTLLRLLASHADRLVDLLTLNAAERLAQVVFHLGKHAGKIVATGVEIEATNEELADLAHVSSFTVSRLLNKWARAGIMTKSRGRVFIYSPEKLLDPG